MSMGALQIRMVCLRANFLKGIDNLFLYINAWFPTLTEYRRIVGTRFRKPIRWLHSTFSVQFYVSSMLRYYLITIHIVVSSVGFSRIHFVKRMIIFNSVAVSWFWHNRFALLFFMNKLFCLSINGKIKAQKQHPKPNSTFSVNYWSLCIWRMQPFF
jgi:hypothetical protein